MSKAWKGAAALPPELPDSAVIALSPGALDGAPGDPGAGVDPDPTASVARGADAAPAPVAGESRAPVREASLPHGQARAADAPAVAAVQPVAVGSGGVVAPAGVAAALPDEQAAPMPFAGVAWQPAAVGVQASAAAADIGGAPVRAAAPAASADPRGAILDLGAPAAVSDQGAGAAVEQGAAASAGQDAAGTTLVAIDPSAMANAVLTDQVDFGLNVSAGNAYSYSALAMELDQVEADYPDLTGAGIKIGILSSSFDLDAGASPGSSYTINGTGSTITDSSLGYVDVLKEGPSGSNDEGRDMADLIHQIAPDAQVYFYTAFDGPSDFASGINTLVSDGVNIIVDDVSYLTEPFYENGGPITSAVEQAVADGVDYFTSAGNQGELFYESIFSAASASKVSLGGGGTGYLMNFGGGTTTQTVTLEPGVTYFDLQWAQPFASFGTSAGVTDHLELQLIAGNITFTSVTPTYATSSDPVQVLGVDNTGTSAVTVQIRIADTNTPSSGLQFKYILYSPAIQNSDGSLSFDTISNVAGGAPAGSYTSASLADGTTSGSVIGHEEATGANTVAAINYATVPYAESALGTSGGTFATEVYSSVGPGVTLFDANGNPVTATSAGDVAFAAPDGSATELTTSFLGTSAAAPNAAAVAALVLQADPAATPAQVTADLEVGAVSTGQPATEEGAGLIDAAAVLGAVVACVLEGTRILTEAGEVAVEALRAGDRVVTASGALRAVAWIGWRTIDVARHAEPAAVWPVRVRAGAFAEGVPCRDVWLSPDHAVFADGVLIAAKHLVNGVTVVRDLGFALVRYFHVELARHDVMIAEGLAVETYLDTGNRGIFDNAVRAA